MHSVSPGLATLPTFVVLSLGEWTAACARPSAAPDEAVADKVPVPSLQDDHESLLMSTALLQRDANILKEDFVDGGSKLLGHHLHAEETSLNARRFISQGSRTAIFCGGLGVGAALCLLGLNMASMLTAAGTCDKTHEETMAQVPDARRRVSEQHSATESLESMHLFWPRCGFLVVLLLFQSLSSLILDGFDGLLEGHSSLVFFLTMIVGTGGNVGGQSVVLTVRKLALGEPVSISTEAWVGLKLCVVLVPLSYARCIVQGVSNLTSLTVAVSVLAITFLGALLGTATPGALCLMRIDPAHATPMIQVLMDILGVFIVCLVGWVILGM